MFLRTVLTCAFLWNYVLSQPRQIWERGFSDQYKSENTLGQYAFGYNEDHTSGGSFRRETGDQYGNKIGSYGLRVADGRIRIVNYVADHNGYRADMVSNEQGVSSQQSNGHFGINKMSIYGVIIPGLRFAEDAPYVTFSNGHQAIPEEVEPKEMATGWDEEKVTEEEPLYAEANAVSDSQVIEDSLSPKATAHEPLSDASTQKFFGKMDSHLPRESRTVESVVETSSLESSNSTNHSIKDEAK